MVAIVTGNKNLTVILDDNQFRMYMYDQNRIWVLLACRGLRTYFGGYPSVEVRHVHVSIVFPGEMLCFHSRRRSGK